MHENEIIMTLRNNHAHFGLCTFTFIFITIYGCLYYEQSGRVVFASATCPDGSWSIKLTKQWIGGQVKVLVEASDEDGKRIGPSIEIGVMEDWSEPEAWFPIVYCTKEEARGGNPRYKQISAGKRGGFAIRKDEFFQ